jgi:hemoglobin
MSTPSLFERLGAKPGIAALVDDVVARHMENPAIRARFRPFLEKPDQLAVVKKHLEHFLAAGGGGPVEYTGRSMRDAHKGMNISGEEYLAAIDDILAALRGRQIDEATQKDVLAIAFALKDDIMRL